MTFEQMVEAVVQLSPAEQEALLQIVRQRQPARREDEDASLALHESRAGYGAVAQAQRMGEEEPAVGLYLPVPDSVARAIRLPEKRLQADLLLELAAALYAQDVLPFGKARELAGLTSRDFARALGQRGVARHYGKEELADDLIYARGE